MTTFTYDSMRLARLVIPGKPPAILGATAEGLQAQNAHSPLAAKLQAATCSLFSSQFVPHSRSGGRSDKYIHRASVYRFPSLASEWARTYPSM